MKIFLDIETIPNQTGIARDYIARTIKPPGTIKLAASIEKWHAESKASAVDDAVSNTGLDGAFGQIVCVGMAWNDQESISFSGMNELEVLTHVNKCLDAVPKNEWLSTVLIGHNVAGFDLRFLVQRYIVNGIRPHAIISRAAEAKPWETDKVYDTMVQWNPDRQNRVSLDKLCAALGIPGKNCGTWEDVLPNALAGNWDAISTYCRNDVDITRACYKRMTFAA